VAFFSCVLDCCFFDRFVLFTMRRILSVLMVHLPWFLVVGLMKTPKKSQADTSAPITPVTATRTYYKRFEVLFISLGVAAREDLVGAPDVGILPVAVPGSLLEASRLTRHVSEGKILELVTAQQFNGVVIDSILETGVDLSREVFEGPGESFSFLLHSFFNRCIGAVVGTFVPAVNQATLVGGLFGVIVVNAEGDFVPQMLRDLAVRHHVSERLAAVQCVPTASMAVKEEDAIAQITEIVVALGKRYNCSSIILAGGFHMPGINSVLR
jgi:Asp/Glu/hydantoin racemase